MPPVVAAIPAVMASVGTIATGIALAGTAVSLVGMVTGSKTLQKIGGVASLVGGVGMGGAALAGGLGTTASKAAAGSEAGNNLFVKGANQLNAASGVASGSDLFSKGANLLNSKGSTINAPTLDKLEQVLTKYDKTANLLGGLGQGYVTYKTEKMKQEVPRLQNQTEQDKLALERDKFNQLQENRGALTKIPNLRQRQEQAQNGLLRSQPL